MHCKNLLVLSSVCLAATTVNTAALGPFEILPFEDGFIQEAYVDLLSGGNIADWTGWSGSSFVSPDAYNGHIGSDFSMQTGTPLYAAAAGTVIGTYSGYAANDHSDPYYGNYVKIAVDGLTPNGDAVNVIYGHMLSVSVSVGQHVNVGDQVGLSDNTGLSDSEHLHFESDLRSGGTAICPLYWAHFKYPIMFNPAGTHQLGRVVRVTVASTAIRNGRFDSSTQIGTAYLDQLYFCSYPKRGYYQVFIPNNTAYRSGWLRATDVEEVFTGTVIQPLPDNVTYVHLGQLASKYPIRASASDGAAQIGEIVFGGGRFVADQISNGYYRIPVPGASATWGWVKPNSRMVVYPELTNPNVNLANLPDNDFPITENFTTTGKSMFGRPKFNRSVVKSFSPAAPGGDGKALFMTDKTNYGTGTSESVTVGKPGHRNYYVQCAVYFSYQPSYLGTDEWERYGIFLRDDGFAGLDTTYEGAGNSYALLWDNDDGRLRAAKLVDAAITDYFPTATYITSSGWHTMRIEAYGTSIKYYLDGNLLVEATDSTFHSGHCGMGYSNHAGGSNPAARGAYFDNFIADTLDPVQAPAITTQPQQQTVGNGGSATFTVAATGTAPLAYQWMKNGANISGATTTALTIVNAQLSDAAFYTVLVSNTGGSVTSSATQLVLTTTPIAPGTGTGLQGSYYDNQDLTTVKIVRTDATVDFDWGTGSPDASIGPDAFSVRWAGQVEPRYTQTYTFYTRTDDGARLWVNGVLLVDQWGDQGPTEWSGSIALAAGQKYDFRLEYYENGGGATAQLRWSCASQLKEIIPTSQLYPNTAPTITTQPQGQAVIAGANVTFSVAAAGTAPLAYQWLLNGAPISGATSSSHALVNVQPSDAGDYSVVVSNLLGSVTSSNATLVVSATGLPPTITAQPQGQSVSAGTAVTFSVVAAGTPPFGYQWRRNGAAIAGASASSYTRSNVQSADVGLYSVVVSNAYGTVTSAEAALTLTAAIAFQDNFESCDLSGWAVYPGASSLDGSNAQNHTPGGGCSARVDNSLDKMYHNFGIEVGGRMRATWWIYDGAQTRAYAEVRAHTGAGYDGSAIQQLLAAGKYSSVTLTGEVWDGTKYQGRVSNGANAGWFNLNAAGAPSRSTSWHKFAIERRADGTTIDFYVDDILSRTIYSATDATIDSILIGSVAAGTTTGEAWIDDVLVEYFDLPSIVTQPVGQTVAAGGNATFSVSATNTVLSYQWRLNGVNIAGATTSSFAINNAQAAHAGSYTVVVANGVGPTVSAAASLTVIDPPVITTPPQDQNVAAGATATFTFTATGTGPLDYQWHFNGTAIAGATGTSYTCVNAQSSNAGPYVVVVSNVGGSVSSPPALLAVNNPPVLSGVRDRSIHAGATLRFTAMASDPDSAQSRTFSLDPGAPAGAEIDAATGVFSWPTSAAQLDTINPVAVRVTDNGVPVLSDVKTFYITVVARPLLQSLTLSNQTVTLQWSAIAETTYGVQFKDSLTPTDWVDLTNVVATSNTASVPDTLGSLTGQRFYRIVVRD